MEHSILKKNNFEKILDKKKQDNNYVEVVKRYVFGQLFTIEYFQNVIIGKNYYYISRYLKRNIKLFDIEWCCWDADRINITSIDKVDNYMVSFDDIKFCNEYMLFSRSIDNINTVIFSELINDKKYYFYGTCDLDHKTINIQYSTVLRKLIEHQYTNGNDMRYIIAS